MTRSYGSQTVLKDVSLTVRSGHMDLVVGASGSGKSTLARLACGLLDPDYGDRLIHIQNGTTESVTGISRDIQFVFQNPFASLNPTRTIGNALSTPLKNYLNLRSGSWKSKAIELLEKLGLHPATDYLDRYPHQLSGGQKQRVVLARALAAEPTFLIADEPTAMLDQSLKHDVYSLFRNLADDFGLGVLMVTHDLLGARAYADQITVLDNGSVIATGTPEHIFTQVETPKVSHLIEAASFPYPEKVKHL